MEYLHSKRLEEYTTQIPRNRASGQSEEEQSFLSQTPTFREQIVMDAMPVQIGH